MKKFKIFKDKESYFNAFFSNKACDSTNKSYILLRQVTYLCKISHASPVYHE